MFAVPYVPYVGDGSLVGPVETWKDVPQNECAWNRQAMVGDGSVCSSPILIDRMRQFLTKHHHAKHAVQQLSDAAVVHEVMRILHVNCESAIYREPSMDAVLGGAIPMNEQRNRLFKVDGATSLDAPLYDNSLNGTLYQWTLLDKTFLGLPFQFLDFADDRKNLLQTLDFKQHLQSGRTRIGVILNSAKSTLGHGEHWFALFFDFSRLDIDKFIRQPYSGKETSLPCTLEYWNSSGNAPYKEIRAYFKHVKRYFRKNLPFVNLWCLSATRGQHQYSHAECGSFAMLYLWKRKQGTPLQYFLRNRLSDSDARMTRFLFYNWSSLKG
jgi:hypothetical protein